MLINSGQNLSRFKTIHVMLTIFVFSVLIRHYSCGCEKNLHFLGEKLDCIAINEIKNLLILFDTYHISFFYYLLKKCIQIYYFGPLMRKFQGKSYI